MKLVLKCAQVPLPTAYLNLLIRTYLFNRTRVNIDISLAVVFVCRPCDPELVGESTTALLLLVNFIVILPRRRIVSNLINNS